MRKITKVEKICIISLIVSVLATACGYFLSTFFLTPKIDIVGDKTVVIGLKEEYIDQGAVALLKEKDISKNIKKEGKIDNTKIGDYTITYSVTNQRGYKKRKAKRTIKVIDKEKPTLKLKGKKTIKTEYGKEFKEPGYTAIDNYDGNISSKVKIIGKVDTNKLGTYKLKYQVSDASLNIDEKTRTVKVVDTTSPKITLSVKERIIIKLNSEYSEPGYTAIDNYDGEITNKVIVSGNIDEKTAGVYKLLYEITDSNGNYSSKYRIVQVGDQTDIDERNYIYVSIKEQKMWYYKNGKLNFSTKVVTGNKGTHDTVTGKFRIKNKVEGTYLIGDDYKTWVNYWMLFDPKNQIGFHDATWRGSFGGRIYEYSGSHGCVNMPYAKAQKLYNNVTVGTLVLVY